MWAALSEGNDVIAGKIQPVGSTLLERTIGRVQTPDPGEMESASILPSSRSIAFAKSQWDAVGGYPEWLRHGQDDAFSPRTAVCRRRCSFRPWRAVVLESAAVPGRLPEGLLQGLPGRGCGRDHRQRSGAAVGGLWLRTGRAWCSSPVRRCCKFAATAAWVAHVGPQQRRVWRSRAGSPDGLPARVLATLAVVARRRRRPGSPGTRSACWRAGTSRRTRQERHRGDSGDAIRLRRIVIEPPSAGRHRRVLTPEPHTRLISRTGTSGGQRQHEDLGGGLRIPGCGARGGDGAAGPRGRRGRRRQGQGGVAQQGRAALLRARTGGAAHRGAGRRPAAIFGGHGRRQRLRGAFRLRRDTAEAR